MSRIGIVDCGISNISSVRNAIVYLGYEATIVHAAADLDRCGPIILPGDGSFPVGMQLLHRAGLAEGLRRIVVTGRPLLGICLGMQLLAEAGEEFESTPGLGFIRGTVRAISPKDPRLPVPQIGWNDVVFRKDSRFGRAIDRAAAFYFMQSYALQDMDEAVVVGTCDYGGTVVSAIEHENVLGVQFHPEKSQRAGLNLLSVFLDMAT